MNLGIVNLRSSPDYPDGMVVDLGLALRFARGSADFSGSVATLARRPGERVGRPVFAMLPDGGVVDVSRIDVIRHRVAGRLKQARRPLALDGHVDFFTDVLVSIYETVATPWTWMLAAVAHDHLRVGSYGGFVLAARTLADLGLIEVGYQTFSDRRRVEFSPAIVSLACPAHTMEDPDDLQIQVTAAYRHNPLTGIRVEPVRPSDPWQATRADAARRHPWDPTIQGARPWDEPERGGWAR